MKTVSFPIFFLKWPFLLIFPNAFHKKPRLRDPRNSMSILSMEDSNASNGWATWQWSDKTATMKTEKNKTNEGFRLQNLATPLKNIIISIWRVCRLKHVEIVESFESESFQNWEQTNRRVFIQYVSKLAIVHDMFHVRGCVVGCRISIIIIGEEES